MDDKELNIDKAEKSEDVNTKDIDEEEKAEEEAYEKALEDFSRRLMVVELPEDAEDSFEKYTKQILGIKCVLALINHEVNLISPLPDDFEAPYDTITLWAIAVKNSVEMAELNKEASKPEMNMHVIKAHSGRAMVCCDDFWNKVCEELNVMRLIVSMYHKEKEKSFIIVSAIPDDEKMDMRTYLNQANKEDEARISYVFVRNVGMLSEAALNSEC